jgi:hypothetical protein
MSGFPFVPPRRSRRAAVVLPAYARRYRLTIEAPVHTSQHEKRFGQLFDVFVVLGQIRGRGARCQWRARLASLEKLP